MVTVTIAYVVPPHGDTNHIEEELLVVCPSTSNIISILYIALFNLLHEPFVFIYPLGCIKLQFLANTIVKFIASSHHEFKQIVVKSLR
jgi:hypothetical protein